MIPIRCGECGKSIRAPDEAAGRRFHCPKCRAVLRVPATTPSPSPAPQGKKPGPKAPAGRAKRRPRGVAGSPIPLMTESGVHPSVPLDTPLPSAPAALPSHARAEGARHVTDASEIGRGGVKPTAATPLPGGTEPPPIEMECEHCGKNMKAPAFAAGRKVRCPKCQIIIKVPAPLGLDITPKGQTRTSPIALTTQSGIYRQTPMDAGNSDVRHVDEKIEMVCSGCQAQMRAPLRAAGRKVRCPKCQTVLDVPVPVGVDVEVLEAQPTSNSPVPMQTQSGIYKQPFADARGDSGARWNAVTGPDPSLQVDHHHPHRDDFALQWRALGWILLASLFIPWTADEKGTVWTWSALQTPQMLPLGVAFVAAALSGVVLQVTTILGQGGVRGKAAVGGGSVMLVALGLASASAVSPVESASYGPNLLRMAAEALSPSAIAALLLLGMGLGGNNIYMHFSDLKQPRQGAAVAAIPALGLLVVALFMLGARPEEPWAMLRYVGTMAGLLLLAASSVMLLGNVREHGGSDPLAVRAQRAAALGMAIIVAANLAAAIGLATELAETAGTSAAAFETSVVARVLVFLAGSVWLITTGLADALCYAQVREDRGETS